VAIAPTRPSAPLRGAAIRALRRARAPAAVTLAMAIAIGPPALAQAGGYRIDPARSSLLLRLWREGAGSRLAHDHVVEATEFAGTIVFDPAAPEAASVAVEVRTASLRVDEPEARRRLGLEGDLSAGQRADVATAMRAAGQLDVARFPTIRFASTRVVRQGDRLYRVTGMLTIHDVTREVSFPARVTLDGPTLTGRARLTFLQSSFGFRPYSTLFGAIRNRDEVALDVELVADPE
jgi:polyisoprenoid-binding protein YceI